jgi:hypothetical protein
MVPRLIGRNKNSSTIRSRPVERLLPVAQERPARRGHHGQRPDSSQAGAVSYASGEPVRQTGIYEVKHRIEHRAEHEVVLLSGDIFPRCETCQGEVSFRLVRTAPYIFQDADFEDL